MAENEQQQSSFLFDDFFASENDPGVEVTIRVRGREVPIRLKSHVTVEDQTAALSAGVTKRLDPETGSIVVDGVNEREMAAALLARAIVSWPFTYPDGSPVPVTPQTVMQLDVEAGNQLSNALGKVGDFQQKNVLAPFAAPSTAA